MTGVIWHDLECGHYTRDLQLWGELADRQASGTPVLDVGAGTGRVTLSLARAGHAVVALDRDPELLEELQRRAAGLRVETVQADARDFDLAGRSFNLILVPMQTVQLLGGAAGRLAFLSCALEHLSPRGQLAVSIAPIDDFEEFRWQEGDPSPLPDIAEIAGRAYFSQPTAVQRQGDTFVLERRREIVDPDGARVLSDDRIALDVLTVSQLQQNGRDAGLRPVDVLRIPPTDEHIASEVVIFGV